MRAIVGWQIGRHSINQVFCMHKILLEKGRRPSIAHPRQLNHVTEEVVKNVTFSKTQKKNKIKRSGQEESYQVVRDRYYLSYF